MVKLLERAAKIIVIFAKEEKEEQIKIEWINNVLHSKLNISNTQDVEDNVKSSTITDENGKNQPNSVGGSAFQLLPEKKCFINPHEIKIISIIHFLIYEGNLTTLSRICFY